MLTINPTQQNKNAPAATRYLRSALTTPARHKSVARAKSFSLRRAHSGGQLIGVKTLLYLVLAVIVILLAVGLLAKIYNAIVGTGAADQDAKLLAKTINDMLADDRPYIQVPLLVRLDGDRIVGFEPGKDDIQVAKSECKPEAGQDLCKKLASDGQTCLQYNAKADMIGLKTKCQGKSCVCSSTGGTVRNCYTVQGTDAPSIILRSNYQGYLSCAERMDDIDNAFKDGLPVAIAGSYTRLVLDKGTVPYLVQSNQVVGNKNSILPVIIEKKVIETTTKNGKEVPKTIAIIISPDSSQVRGRDFYLNICQGETNDPCAGKTGASSYDAATHKYCAHSLSQPTCYQQEMTNCGSFCGTVTEPCLCQYEKNNIVDGVATYGYCSKTSQAHIPTNCEVVTECSEYCNQDGDKRCTEKELATCNFDVCRVTSAGHICTSTGGGTGQGGASVVNVVRSWFGSAILDQQCTEISDTGNIARLHAQEACSTT